MLDGMVYLWKSIFFFLFVLPYVRNTILNWTKALLTFCLLADIFRKQYLNGEQNDCRSVYPTSKWHTGFRELIKSHFKIAYTSCVWQGIP